MHLDNFPKNVGPQSRRIELWIDNIERSPSLNSPQSPIPIPPRRYNTRKRGNQAADTSEPPTKRRDTGKRRALAATSGNMGLNERAAKGSKGSPERQTRRTAALDTERGRQNNHGRPSKNESPPKTGDPTKKAQKIPLRPADVSDSDDEESTTRTTSDNIAASAPSLSNDGTLDTGVFSVKR